MVHPDDPRSTGRSAAMITSVRSDADLDAQARTDPRPAGSCDGLADSIIAIVPDKFGFILISGTALPSRQALTVALSKAAAFRFTLMGFSCASPLECNTLLGICQGLASVPIESLSQARGSDRSGQSRLLLILDQIDRLSDEQITELAGNLAALADGNLNIGAIVLLVPPKFLARLNENGLPNLSNKLAAHLPAEAPRSSARGGLAHKPPLLRETGDPGREGPKKRAAAATQVHRAAAVAPLASGAPNPSSLGSQLDRDSVELLSGEFQGLAFDPADAPRLDRPPQGSQVSAGGQPDDTQRQRWKNPIVRVCLLTGVLAFAVAAIGVVHHFRTPVEAVIRDAEKPSLPRSVDTEIPAATLPASPPPIATPAETPPPTVGTPPSPTSTLPTDEAPPPVPAESTQPFVGPDSAPSQPPGVSAPAGVAVISHDEIVASVARGDFLFSNGDIASARLYYERAANAGEAGAALRLGETFDPAFLSRAKIRGVQGDLVSAARWYRRALELGANEAQALLDALENH
jgi:hypothetical protein